MKTVKKKRHPIIILAGVLMSFAVMSCQRAPADESPAQASPAGVVYEIFVGSFADSNGDGIGDLAGIGGKLDYLVKLGVSELWLTPIHPSPSYHHYDVLDYYAVDPAFGTLEDLWVLAEACHVRGMRLYLDLVINHTSSQHPWVSEHPDWYADKNFFGEHMPELDLDNAAVREEIRQIVTFYLSNGIDGFRLDASLHYYEARHESNIAFLSWLNETVKEVKPDAYMVSEVWTDFSYVKNYYASGIDSFFDFGLSDSTGDIAAAIRSGKGRTLAFRMADHAQAIREVSAGGIDAVFLSNHDQGRSGGYYTSAERQKLAASVVILSPGKPFLYYGEEIGLRGSGRDENKRMAMPWGEGNDCVSPADCDYTAQITDTVLSQQKDADSLWHHYTMMLDVRSRLPWLAQPGLTVQSHDLGDEALFCLEVTSPDGTETVFILHNFSDKEEEVTLPGKAESIRLAPYGSAMKEG